MTCYRVNFAFTDQKKANGEVSPAHSMKEYRGSRIITLLIPNLSTRQKLAITSPSGHFTSKLRDTGSNDTRNKIRPNHKEEGTVYTGCNRRNGPDFGRVFLRSYYTDITQNTYIQSSMVTEILAREV